MVVVALALGLGIGGEPAEACFHGMGGDPVLSARFVHGLAVVGAHRRRGAALDTQQVLPAVEVPGVFPVKKAAGDRDQTRLEQRRLAGAACHGRKAGSCWSTCATRSGVGFQAASAPVAGTGRASS